MALNFDNLHETVGSGSSTSDSYTATGSNLILFCEVFQADGAGGQTVNSITYNGVNLTHVDSVTSPVRYVQLWMLVGPSTGANTIQVNLGGTPSNGWRFATFSYTGANQSGQPDNHTTSSTSNTTTTLSLATVADNCWIIGAGMAEGGGTVTAGTNTDIRLDSSSNHQLEVVDTNSAQTPAGSHSMVVNATNTAQFNFCIVSISPDTGFSISVSDGMTTTESVTVRSTLNPIVFEILTITESVKMILGTNINVHDTLTTTEIIHPELDSSINVHDTLTTTEFKNIGFVTFISVVDSLIITENYSDFLPVLFLSVSDSLTITESAKPEMFVFSFGRITQTPVGASNRGQFTGSRGQDL